VTKKWFSRRSFAEILQSHTDTADPESCWRWGGKLDVYGYGRLGSGQLAHRHSYVEVHGAIPTGLQIDHLCRVRDCVNPNHLEAVTARVNSLRSESVSAINARKTHCPQGHEYDEANTYIAPNGGRSCRSCNRVRAAEYRARKEMAA
jgi:hypothetical protein